MATIKHTHTVVVESDTNKFTLKEKLDFIRDWVNPAVTKFVVQDWHACGPECFRVDKLMESAVTVYKAFESIDSL